MEAVSLDEMDGFEFQHFVGHLFERLGYGKVEEIRQARDAGKDVIVRSVDGSTIIIECKHHPRGIVGRPTVQKLHSAVITAKAKKGFVVTTGHFSPEASSYTKSLGALIELVDSRILYDMASRAGIRVLKKGEDTSVFHILPPSQELIEKKTVEHLIGYALSRPYTPQQLAKTTVVNTYLFPVYLIRYRLHEDFSTTVGVIHRIHVDDGRILINGDDGEFVNPRLERMITPSSMVEDWNPYKQQKISTGRFKLGYAEAKTIGIRHIQRYHQKAVSYYGDNNVRYTKTCVPSVSRILIRNLTQVYLPLLSISSEVLTRKHQLTLFGNRNEVDVLKSDAGTCEICGKALRHERLLCNSCGRIVCSPSLFGHSYRCEICSKTICRQCTYWTRKYVLFKKKLCYGCAHELESTGKTIMKFT